MYNIGIIDIGSNSIRLVVAEIYTAKAFKIIYELKESVRLAKDMTSDGKLNSDRMDSAIKTLKLFKNICDGFEVKSILSVATAAVRTASNQQHFLDRVKNEAAINIRVLTGIEEAYYDYFGIINSMSETDCIIMDIGGASAEIIWVENRKLKQSICLPFGAITLSEKFNLLEDSDKSRQESINNFLTTTFENIPWLKEISCLPLIGIGGTIRNIGKIHRKKIAFPLEFIHNYTLESEEVIDIYNSIKEMNLKQRKKVKGLSKDRADIFLGAASVVNALIKYCNCPTLSISGSGVREGLLYEYILKGHDPVEDVLEFSLNSLICIHELNSTYNEQVWKLSYRLFGALQPVHQMNTEMLNVLKTSSLLYNIGVSIDYYNNNNHSFYMILNSNINGLTHKEKLMAAYTASIIKKDGLQDDIDRFENILLEEDIASIYKLALILKISVILNLRRINIIRDILAKIVEDTAFIKLISEHTAELEINNVMSIAADFEKILKKKLILLQ